MGLVEELGSSVREHLVGLLVHLKANPASTRIGLVFTTSLTHQLIVQPPPSLTGPQDVG